MRIVPFILVVTILLMGFYSYASDHKEKFYQEQWCLEHKGEVEATLSDRTRADCITNSHAVEFDFAPKWKEAIGQALWYAIQENKKPGIVLIIEKPKHRTYWIKLNTVIKQYNLPIDTWALGKGARELQGQ